MEINNKLENLTKEELYEKQKQYLLTFYQQQITNLNKLDNNTESIELLNKSIENINESIIGTFGENKLKLYNLTSMLNQYFRKRLENKRNDIGFKNIMEKVTTIFNGFGDKTKEICDLITYTDNFNPDDAVKYYCELYGLNYIPHNEIQNNMKELLYNGNYEDYAKLSLEEGYLTKNSILTNTMEEIVNIEQNKRRI